MPFHEVNVEGSCIGLSWPLHCTHGQLTEIRLAPSCFRSSIIFVDIDIPYILYITLKVMSARMSSRDNLTMVEMAPNWWEYVVRRILSRSATCR